MQTFIEYLPVDFVTLFGISQATLQPHRADTPGFARAIPFF